MASFGYIKLGQSVIVKTWPDGVLSWVKVLE